MDFNEIKELITLIDNSNLAYFELKIDNGYLKMDKSLNRNSSSSKHLALEDIDKRENKIEQKDVATNNISVSVNNKVEDEEKKEDLEEFKIVKAPMVGTFYSASSPESKPFVEEGQQVKVGDTLCILEAMKLMNEIDSEVKGTVVEILAKDGEMVEYGTPLFKIKED